MPVSASASAGAGVDLASVTDAMHHAATATTTPRGLGDVRPVPLPVRAEVISQGDLLVAAGLTQLVFMASGRAAGGPIVLRTANRRTAPAITESASTGELAAQ